MNPPKTIFGYSAHWQPGTAHVEVSTFDIRNYKIHALRWELSNVRLEGLDLPCGHVLTFVVETSDQAHHLIQGSSTFYQEEGGSRLAYRKKEFPQGDGANAPKWHKCDRLWPEDDGQVYKFIGQGYFTNEVVYLFQHPSAYRLAIFTDQLDRQDAEEHYATEEGEANQSA